MIFFCNWYYFMNLYFIFDNIFYNNKINIILEFIEDEETKKCNIFDFIFEKLL